MNAMPPDPPTAARRGRASGCERLEATPPWLFEWLRQQHDGPYWRQGSLAPDYDADRGDDPQRRRLDGRVRRRRAPDAGQPDCPAPDDHRQLGPRPARRRPTPGPNLDWLHEVVRFFDHWLKGIDNGAEDEPALT